MGIKRTIEIDGQEVAFKASAAIPRIYRLKFHRDIYKDLAALEKSVGDNSEGSSGLDMFSLEMFENMPCTRWSPNTCPGWPTARSCWTPAPWWANCPMA